MTQNYADVLQFCLAVGQGIFSGGRVSGGGIFLFLSIYLFINQGVVGLLLFILLFYFLFIYFFFGGGGGWGG